MTAMVNGIPEITGKVLY